MRKCWLEALRIDPVLVRNPFEHIQTLFVIERAIRGGTPAEKRSKVRREQAGPIVEKFFDWWLLHEEQALDGLPLYAAIGYSRNQREALQRFVSDQRLPMRNNISERALRRRVVGSKNWIFVGCEDGARANTTFVSLLASCAMHGIEPWAYLRDLLCLLPGLARASRARAGAGLLAGHDCRSLGAAASRRQHLSPPHARRASPRRLSNSRGSQAACWLTHAVGRTDT